MFLKIRIAIVVFVLAQAGLAVGAEPPGQGRETGNTYPDPGYTLLGAYRDADPKFFDYEVGYIVNWSGDTFPNKKQWWEDFKKAYQTNPNAKYKIISGYFGIGHATYREEGLTCEKVKIRLDAFLAPEPGIPTYPELLHGLAISEENTTYTNADLMDCAARYALEKYGVPVWQWLSPPSPPSPRVAAAGWVYDMYGPTYEWFRKHTMKYVCMEKPIHAMVWASDPTWYIKYPNGQALIEDTNEELAILKEFNISTSFFAVAQPGGSVYQWKGKNNPDMAAIRKWTQQVRQDMHRVAPGMRKVMDSANHSQGVPIEVARPGNIPMLYEDDFTAFKWIDDASISGFLDMKLTNEPEERPGFLLANTRAEGPVEATLIYEFKSPEYPLSTVHVRLDAAAPAASKSRNQIALSLDKNTWPLSAEQAGNDQIEPVTLTADSRFINGAKSVFVRIRMQNDAGSANALANRLDHLSVQCGHKGVALWWNDWGTVEQQGNWAKFFRPDKNLDIDGDDQGGSIQLETTGPTGWGTQRIDAPEGHTMKDIVVDWGMVYRDTVSCNGFWEIQLSTTGEFAGEQVTAKTPEGRNRLRLSLDLRENPDFIGISTMYIRLAGSNGCVSGASFAGPISIVGTLTNSE